MPFGANRASVVTTVQSRLSYRRNVSGKFPLESLDDAGAPAICNAFGIGSGKISSSPLSKPLNIPAATRPGGDFGTSKPRVMSVSTGPVKQLCTVTPCADRSAQKACIKLCAAAFESE